MRTRLLIALALLGLVVAPAVALASHGGGKSQVTYELKGTLSAYTPAKGTTPGSITIHVTGGNKAGRAFKGDTLAFRLMMATRVETNDLGTIADGDRGEIQVRGPAGLDMAGIQKQAPRKVADDAEDQDESGDGGGDHGDHGDHGDD